MNEIETPEIEKEVKPSVTTYKTNNDGHGDQKTSSIVEFDPQLPAVRANVHVVDGMSAQLIDGFRDAAQVLHRSNCE